MSEGPFVAEVAALIGDPARANILAALLDGKARTATELSYLAGVSPQTTSGHLAKLAAGRLLALERQGRHRYYRLAGPAVAEAMEALIRLAADGPPRHRPTGPRDEAMRAARTCYDHLAGRLGVAIADRLRATGRIVEADGGLRLSGAGEAFLDGLGIDPVRLRQERRPLLRPCLDWSERRHHLAGAAGAALASRCFDLGWIRRLSGSRAVTVTEIGRDGLRGLLGLSWP